MRCVLHRTRRKTGSVRETSRTSSRAPCASEPAFGGRQNLTRRVPRSLMDSSRPKARTAHIGFVRLARENPRFNGWNLVRCVPQALMYSSRPKARTAHIAPVRLVDENPHFSGRQNLMRCVLHGTRRKTGSVRETSRAVRTFGVRPVRIGFARLAHQNLRF